MSAGPRAQPYWEGLDCNPAMADKVERTKHVKGVVVYCNL